MAASSIAYRCTWTDPDGNILRPIERILSAPGSVALTGELPIAAGLQSGAEVDIAFEGIAVGATLVVIENKSGQELGMAWGGNFSPNLPAGGVMIYALPACPASGRICALRFFLTQAQQATGFVTYLVVGD